MKPLSTPLAILIGSCIIAVGAYFGLRDRTVVTGTPPGSSLLGAPSSAPILPSSSPAPPPGAPPSMWAPPTAAKVAEVQKAAAAALEARRAHFVKTCWAPSAAKNPEPAKARYVFDMTFDASGKQITQGISEVRGMERPETGRCLRDQPMSLTIPPPGANVGVQITFDLP